MSKNQGWRLIDHTADIGLEVEAADLPRLFERAAEGLFAQIADRQETAGERSEAIEVAGIDWPDLMFNWLRELLYLWAGRQRLVTGVRLHRVAPYRLCAEVRSAAFDPSVHRVGEEIKAVTYHQLRVEPTRAGWRARVFFDV